MSNNRKLGKAAQQVIDLSQSIPGFVSLAPRRGADHKYLDKGERKPDEVEYVWLWDELNSFYRLAVIELATGEVLDTVEVDAPHFDDPVRGCPTGAQYDPADLRAANGPCRLYDHPASVPHRSIQGKEF